MPSSTDDIDRFVSLLTETSSLWRLHLSQRIKPTGISAAQWRVLSNIKRAREPLTQSDLAGRVGIEAATLVSLLDRLEAAEWVERRPHPQDRRFKTVHLRDKALPILAELEIIAAQLRRELLGEIDAEELRSGTELLRKIQLKMEPKNR